MLSLLARARTYRTLTPAERALLKLAKGLLCTALIAALPIVAQALARSPINWTDVLRTALAKYAKAHGDPALGDALAATGAALQDHAGPSNDRPAA